VTDAEREFQNRLRRLIELAAEDEESGFDELLDARVATFEESGVLTMNAGLVVRLADGDEFQVTVVQSDRGGR
jgi:hypothetical protein